MELNTLEFDADKFSQHLELEDPVRSLYLQCNEVFYERESLSDLSGEACLIYLALVFDLVPPLEWRR